MKNTLISLSNSYFIGSEHKAADIAKEMLTPYVDEIETDLTGSIFATIYGKTDKNIMIEAHIDEIGFTVTDVLENGFVKLSKVGGIDIRVLPASTVIIHGKKDVYGVFTSTPPHLAKGKSKEFSDIDELYLDTGIQNVKEFVSIGDFATYNTTAKEMENGYITGKSMDDRSGCTALIEVAKLIKQNGKPNCNIIILLASGEELGNRGAKIGGFGRNIEKAIAVDVSFGVSPGAPADKCGECGKGPMIGVSPILDKEMLKKLVSISKDKNIAYQLEPMNGLTSTDADVLTVTEQGISCSLISIPLKYMHTPIETVCLSDIKSVADLIYNFLKEE